MNECTPFWRHLVNLVEVNMAFSFGAQTKPTFGTTTTTAG